MGGRGGGCNTGVGQLKPGVATGHSLDTTDLEGLVEGLDILEQSIFVCFLFFLDLWCFYCETSVTLINFVTSAASRELKTSPEEVYHFLAAGLCTR